MKNSIQQLLRITWIQKIINPAYGKKNLEPQEKICIVPGVTNRLGDMVMNNHFIKQLKRNYEVIYLVPDFFYERHKDFLDNHCLAERLLVLPCGCFKKLKFIRRLRRENIKAVVLLPHSPVPIDAYCFIAGIPIICGMQGTSIFTSHHYNLEKFKNLYHYVHVAECILDALRCQSDGIIDNSSWFPYVLTPKKHAIPECLSLAMHVGGESYWMRKWPFEKYIKLSMLFLDKYNGILHLVGGKDEYDNNERFKKILVDNGYPEEKIINHGGCTLNSFANVLSKVDAFLGNDSGPMHVATAMRKRVICIFGPSDIHFVTPVYIDGSNKAIYTDLECVPCLAPKCKLDKEIQYSCLNDLSVAKVWNGLNTVAEETLIKKIF